MFEISSIVIAKNEENNIKKCIESQLDCIDEIIVLVDSSTIDKTFEIADSYENTRCEIIDWMGYAKTKQYGIDKAKNDWIFWIDADEVIKNQLSDELNEFRKSKPKYFVYNVARRAFFLGKWIKHSGWYPGRVNRLFDRRNAKFSTNQVHEYLEFEGNVGQLINDLEHYTDPSIRHYFSKLNSYTSLAAKEMYMNKKRSNINDIFFRPIFIFFKMYILKLGFLDGFHGFILAMFSSIYVGVKYTKLWELNKETD